MPLSVGVDGFLHPWVFNQQTGERELCYANGDFSRMGEILHKLQAERANCVVVYPYWPRYWQVMWAQLPVRRCFTLPRLPDLGIPGPRVDSRKNRAAHHATRSRWLSCFGTESYTSPGCRQPPTA